MNAHAHAHTDDELIHNAARELYPAVSDSTTIIPATRGTVHVPIIIEQTDDWEAVNVLRYFCSLEQWLAIRDKDWIQMLALEPCMVHSSGYRFDYNEEHDILAFWKPEHD